MQISFMLRDGNRRAELRFDAAPDEDTTLGAAAIEGLILSLVHLRLGMSPSLGSYAAERLVEAIRRGAGGPE